MEFESLKSLLVGILDRQFELYDILAHPWITHVNLDFTN